MKLKKYTMEQLNKVKVVLNENEVKFLKGGYTDLGDGHAELSYTEMLMVFTSIRSFPSYILEELNEGLEEPYDFINMGDSDAQFLFGDRMFVVSAKDMGPYSIYWSISSGEDDPSESSSESSVSEEEPDSPVTVSDFSDIIQTYNYVGFATSIVEILISANIQSNIENTAGRISSQLSTIYEELTRRGYSSMSSLTHDISLESSMCYIYFDRIDDGLNVYTYSFHI